MSLRATSCRVRAFTLLELIVVVALIAALAAIVAPILKKDVNTEAKIAESLVSGLLYKARAEAILRQQSVRLIIATDPAKPDAYLRQLAIVAQNSTSEWIIIDGPHELPLGMAVLPSASPPSNGLWPASAVSSFGGTDTASIVGFPSSVHAYFNFAKNGNTTASRQLLLSPVQNSAEGIRFYLPEQVRIFLLRGSGTHVLMRDAGSL